MATSTFDRELKLTNPEAVIKLLTIAETEPPSEPFCKNPFTEEDRKRGEKLLRYCLSHSKR